MRNLLRYLFLIPIGYLAACCAAGWVTSVGIYGSRFDIEVVGFFIGNAIVSAGGAATYAFLPTLVAIITAEIRAWRSVIFWMIFGGLAGLFIYLGPYAAQRVPGDNDYRLVFAAAGFVGGFVYWLIAGRLSGERSATGSAPPAA